MKVLAIVRGQGSDDEVVSCALEMAHLEAGLHHAANGRGRQSRWRLYLLYVIRIPRSLPIDADVEAEVKKADSALRRLEDLVRANKETVEGSIVQAREAGPAIVHEAAIREVDAIVTGMDFHAGLGDFQLDADVSYVLEHAPCGVLLWRRPPRTMSPVESSARLARIASGHGGV